MAREAEGEDREDGRGGGHVIHRGDLFNVLPTLDVESVDACVTDPPYGIGFMGKKWDNFKPGIAEARIVPNRAIDSDNPNLKGRTRGPASSPSAVEYDYSVTGLIGFQQWTERWAREVLRVLKPGAHLLVCGAPRSFHRMTCGLEDAGFTVRDCLSWLYGQGFPKSLNLGDGRGTALKPSWEPIVLARKPTRGTVAKNVAQHGTGALNIDVCRVSYGEKTLEEVHKKAGSPGRGPGPNGVRTYNTGWHDRDRMVEFHQLGRWPANVVLDEEAARLLDEMTGELRAGGDGMAKAATRGYEGGWKDRPVDAYRDTGGASRFYYVAKPSREERDYGYERVRNIHPTVKPVELMRWLVRLVTPPEGVVLDPFCGSGTTGMACRYELRRFIGIEREPEYADIAERRIAAVAPLFAEEMP